MRGLITLLYLALLAAIISMLLAGCDLSTEATVTVYICAVDSDTLHVPNDTTGVRCAVPDSLPKG